MFKDIHPTETQLALYAGGDLSLLERWRIRRHAASCGPCREQVEGLSAARIEVRQTATALPPDLNWNRLANEMSANIRLGLEAGECIAGFEKRTAPARPPRLGWNAAMVLASATAVMGVTIWLSLPKDEAGRLAATLSSIRWNRVGTLIPGELPVTDSVVIEASPSALEIKENGGAMSLLHPSSGEVTVSVGLQGSAGVRYVDANTDQVTTNKVYYAQ
jgi:putative zinc finger protein